MILISTVLLALSLTVSSRPSQRSDFVLHESRESAPAGFVNIGSADPDTPLPLRIALVEGNIQGLRDTLMSVSTPGSDKYRQYLSKEEVS